MTTTPDPDPNDYLITTAQLADIIRAGQAAHAAGQLGSNPADQAPGLTDPPTLAGQLEDAHQDGDPWECSCGASGTAGGPGPSANSHVALSVWCLRMGERWCAVASGLRPDDGAVGVPTRCGGLVTYANHRQHRPPTCTRCLTVTTDPGEDS